ncbi:MAG: glycosyltransferase [Planctomycetota bacterium]
MSAPRLLHLFATFDAGGPQVRQATLFAALGDGMRHAVVALDGRLGCAPRLPPGVEVVEPGFDPRGRGAVRRLRAFLRGRPHDLCVTYNWGAFDALRAALREGQRRSSSRSTASTPRRPGRAPAPAPRAAAVLTGARPGRRAVAHARGRGPHELARAPARLHRLSNGVDLQRFAPGDRDAARRRFGLPQGGVVLGAVGDLRPVKDHATWSAPSPPAASPRPASCWPATAPTARRSRPSAASSASASASTCAARSTTPPPYAPALDLLAFSSLSEQQPMAALEAMACGLPLCGTAVGDLPALCGDPSLCVAPRDGRARRPGPAPAAMPGSGRPRPAQPPAGRAGVRSQEAMVAAYPRPVPRPGQDPG